MAGRATADIVFCMDASGSMRPTFDGVRAHVFELVDSLKADLQHSWDVRFDFLAYNVSYDCGGKAGFVFKTVGRSNMEVIDGLYRTSRDSNGESAPGFFTRDIEKFKAELGMVECMGEETTGVALDMAADFPFRDATTCHRAIVLLTDEPLETGNAVAETMPRLMDLARKLQDRRIALYMVTPQSEAYDTLSQIDKCEWTVVDDASNGLRTVDFGKLMQCVGKSVSVSQTSASSDSGSMPLYNEPGWTDAGHCVKTDLPA